MRDEPALPYTELEFQTATDAGPPRLVFLVDEDADGPARLFRDVEHGARQEAFRAALTAEAGPVVDTVASPDRLETLLLQALSESPRATAADVPVGHLWNIPARDPDFTGRVELLDELDTTPRPPGCPVASRPIWHASTRVLTRGSRARTPCSSSHRGLPEFPRYGDDIPGGPGWIAAHPVMPA